MIEALEPLASLPGVRLVILVAPDGVPVVVHGKAARKNPNQERTFLEENTDSFSGLAAGWIQELSSSIAPLGWNAPWRVMMRAARGTLVMINAPGSMLALVLDPGGSAEAMRLPMEGAVARMQRILRANSARSRQANPAPPQALPSPGAQPPVAQPEDFYAN